MPSPDRRRDDAFYADLFPTTGDRTFLAQMMNTTASSVTQQLAQENDDKSYYHAGKLSLYAADMKDKIDGGTRGEVLWNDLAASRAAWLGSPRPVKVKFPARLAHEVVEIELNTAELDSIPATRRLQLIRRLIRDLQSYEAGMLLDGLDDEGGGEGSRGEEGQQRERRETDPPEPFPVASSPTTAERRAS